MKGIYMFMADGFEDVEALGTRDVLVRGGVDVVLVGIAEKPYVTSARGAVVKVDTTLGTLLSHGLSKKKACQQDVMIFPGGMPGAKYLGECKPLVELMNDHYEEGGSVAAICAAPAQVLSQLKGIEKAEFTCYDTCEEKLVAMGARFLRQPTVTCGRIITGRGPGHALDFGLAILKHVKGSETAYSVASDMILVCDTISTFRK